MHLAKIPVWREEFTIETVEKLKIDLRKNVGSGSRWRVEDLSHFIFSVRSQESTGKKCLRPLRCRHVIVSGEVSNCDIAPNVKIVVVKK